MISEERASVGCSFPRCGSPRPLWQSDSCVGQSLLALRNIGRPLLQMTGAVSAARSDAGCTSGCTSKQHLGEMRHLMVVVRGSASGLSTSPSILDAARLGLDT